MTAVVRFTIHPELPATDIAQAHAWYAGKLGPEPVTADGDPYREGDAIEPDSELLYETATARFGVYRSDHAGRNLGPDFRTVVGVLTSPDGERTSC